MENKEGCCSATKDTNCATDKGSCSTGKGCWTKLIKGTIVGGIVLFAVFMLSCFLIPVHKNTVVTYSKANEIVVEAPSMSKAMKAIGKELKNAISSPEAAPVVDKPVAKQIGCALLLSLIGGLLLTKMMKGNCGCPCSFSVATGLLVGLFAYAPGYIWHAAPLNYTLIGLGTSVVAFALAGLALSKLVLKCSDSK